MTGTVLVTGATGVLGRPLCIRLVESGYRVRALVRKPTNTLGRSVQLVVGDLSDARAVAQSVTGTIAIVHLAAMLHVNRPSPSLQAQYVHVNVDGTQRLVDHARMAGVERFVLASTISVYGSSDDRPPFVESDPICPASQYAETKAAAEAIVRTLPGGVALRLAAVYGPGMKGNYPKLLRSLDRGVRIMPGDGTNRRTLVHIDDAAAAFVEGVRSATPGTYNVTDGQIHSFDEIIRSMQAALGRREGIRYVRTKTIDRLLAFPKAAFRLAGRTFPASGLVDKMLEDVAVDGTAYLKQSAYRPAPRTLADEWHMGGAPR